MFKPPVKVTRLPIIIEPDIGRVIPRFFGGDDARDHRRVKRVLSLSDNQVDYILSELKKEYAAQHAAIEDIWADHFKDVKCLLPDNTGEISRSRELLIGAYFTMEYAIEAAALFNPSIVPSLKQSDLPDGSTRFLMSLRATGEGHISSIVFRRGVIDKDNNIIIEAPSKVSRPLKAVPDAEFHTKIFRQTLSDIGALGQVESVILDKLGDTFNLHELSRVIEEVHHMDVSVSDWEQSAENLMTLARSNYRLEIPEDVYPSEVVIFPTSENESRGIEDLRLVNFTDDDGSVCIYGTYTAFNGFAIFPTLLSTRDLKSVEIHTVAGKYAKNKGMALFPRRIDGKYVMSGRLDGENLYILESDNIYVWNKGRLSQEPAYWWEYNIIGNCGSPIETEEGWLLLTHGVGPMRQYCIGATLLDLDDPGKVIGRTREPLLMPVGEQRAGYVPNVVYTCGALAHNDILLIPYAMSDRVTAFAYVDMQELLSELRLGGK